MIRVAEEITGGALRHTVFFTENELVAFEQAEATATTAGQTRRSDLFIFTLKTLAAMSLLAACIVYYV